MTSPTEEPSTSKPAAAQEGPMLPTAGGGERQHEGQDEHAHGDKRKGASEMEEDDSEEEDADEGQEEHAHGDKRKRASEEEEDDSEEEDSEEEDSEEEDDEATEVSLCSYHCSLLTQYLKLVYAMKSVTP
jgi:hypothetical protein